MAPVGYERLLLGHAVAVARSDLTASIRRALVGADGTRMTLYEYAARHPSMRELQGRGMAYSVTLPQNPARVVVKHNRHGGLFASLTRDRFLAPTRAPYELEVSTTLATLGVPTPEIVAYVLYPPGALFQRADVCSREIAQSRDLMQVISRDAGAERQAAFAAAARLVAALARAGARHHDLNARNILLTADQAYVLDVDRVSLNRRPDAALESNLARLTHSLRGSPERFGTTISETEIDQFEERVRAEWQRP